MLFLQNLLYCLMFIIPVKCAVRNNGLNCLYFYPAEYIEEAERRGIADKESAMKKGKCFDKERLGYSIIFSSCTCNSRPCGIGWKNLISPR